MERADLKMRCCKHFEICRIGRCRSSQVFDSGQTQVAERRLEE